MSPRQTSPEPQVPVFEVVPAFEEAAGLASSPGRVARAVLDGGSAQGEELRLLALRLRAIGRDKRLRRIGVVGPTAGEGTSTVALGLASALAAERRSRVLLLELDLRRPTLDRALGLEPPEAGVRAYLGGRGETPVLSRPSGTFWMLSAGAPAGKAGDPLASPRLAALLRAADRVFDHVVADCPPLLESGEAAALHEAVDGFVLVVRARHAPQEAVRRAAGRLPPGRIVGLVLNGRRDWFRRRTAGGRPGRPD